MVPTLQWGGGGGGGDTETQRGSATGPELHTWKVTHLEGIHSYV